MTGNRPIVLRPTFRTLYVVLTNIHNTLKISFSLLAYVVIVATIFFPEKNIFPQYVVGFYEGGYFWNRTIPICILTSLVVAILHLPYGYLKAYRIRYEFFPNIIVVVKGGLGNEKEEAGYEKLARLRKNSTFLQRIFRLGDIEVSALMGGTEHNVYISNIATAKSAYKMLAELRDSKK